MRRHPSTLLAPLLVALAVSPVRSAPAPAVASDQGSFIVSSHGRPVGREDFKFSLRGDSLVLESEAELTLDPEQPTRKKYLRSSYHRDSWMLLTYNSSLAWEGEVFRVGVAPGLDTTVTVYHEHGVQGEGNTYARPPGRLFVLDAQFYSLFQVIAGSLATQDFESRPITILAVGTRDTVAEAVVRRAGTESIRWGARPVSASKLRFEQGRLVFDLWLDARNRVLRIAHAPSGLVVERKAPAVRRPAKPKPPG